MELYNLYTLRWFTLHRLFLVVSLAMMKMIHMELWYKKSTHGITETQTLVENIKK